MRAPQSKTKGIASWPQDERPRERLLSKGAQALTDSELVAILILVGFKGTNALEMARLLLKQFGSLRAMVEAPVIALLEVKGLKGAKAAQMYQRLKSIDDESKDSDDPKDRTSYAKKFPRAKCEAIVAASLKHAKIKTGKITDDNRQKFLQSLGTLRRKAASEELKPI